MPTPFETMLSLLAGYPTPALNIRQPVIQGQPISLPPGAPPQQQTPAGLPALPTTVQELQALSGSTGDAGRESPGERGIPGDTPGEFDTSGFQSGQRIGNETLGQLAGAILGTIGLSALTANPISGALIGGPAGYRLGGYLGSQFPDAPPSIPMGYEEGLFGVGAPPGPQDYGEDPGRLGNDLGPQGPAGYGEDPGRASGDLGSGDDSGGRDAGSAGDAGTGTGSESGSGYVARGGVRKPKRRTTLTVAEREPETIVAVPESMKGPGRQMNEATVIRALETLLKQLRSNQAGRKTEERSAT